MFIFLWIVLYYYISCASCAIINDRWIIVFKQNSHPLDIIQHYKWLKTHYHELHYTWDDDHVLGYTVSGPQKTISLIKRERIVQMVQRENIYKASFKRMAVPVTLILLKL